MDLILELKKQFASTFLNAQSYPLLLRQPFKVSLRFFLAAMIAIGLVIFTTTVYRDFPKLKTASSQELDKAAEYFPEDLVVNWDGKRLTLSPEQKLEIDFPESLRNNDEDLPEKIASYQPVESISEQAETNSLFSFSKTNVKVGPSTFGFTFDLAQLELFSKSFSISKDSLPEQIPLIKQEISSSLDESRIYVFVLSPLIALLVTIAQGIVDLIFLFLILLVTGTRFSIKKVVQLGLHLSVVASLVAQIANLIYEGVQFPIFTIAFWSLFIYLWYVNKDSLRKAFKN